MAIGGPKLIYRLASAAAGPSNTTTETVVDSYVAPANQIASGKLLLWTGVVVQSAVNGTDTIRVRNRIGPTTLTGTAVGDTTATTGAAASGYMWHLWILAASSTQLTVWGTYTAFGAVGTATARVAYTAITSLDFTAALRFETTVAFGAASASNVCAIQSNALVEWAS